MKIWIFLPAFNEAESLERLLPKLNETLANLITHEAEIVVLDDGSADSTAKVVESAANAQSIVLLPHSINRGLGETERDGFEYLANRCADEDIIIRLDCDDTHEPIYIQSMIDKLAEGYDVVGTSRFQPGGYQKGVNWYRRGISSAANTFMKVLFGIKGIKDYSCGYRAYRAKAIKDAVQIYGNGFLQMRGLGFTSTLETIVKLNLLGFRFAEVPFGLRYDQRVTESKMVASITILGYFIMAFLYHFPRSGWRKWGRPLKMAREKSTGAAVEAYASIKRSKSIPSRFGV